MAHLFESTDGYGTTPRRVRQPLQQQFPPQQQQTPQTPTANSRRSTSKTLTKRGTPGTPTSASVSSSSRSSHARPRTPSRAGGYAFNAADSPRSQAESARAMRVICHGWLLKQTVVVGGGATTLLAVHKPANRWFVADPSGLSYYKEPPAYGTTATAAKAKLHIPWAAIVTVRSVLSDDLRPPRVDATKAYFAIQHAAGNNGKGGGGAKPRWMTLAADSREERVMWLDTLRDCVPQRLSKGLFAPTAYGGMLAPGAGAAVVPPSPSPPQPAAAVPEWSDEVDGQYFGGYSRLCIHEEMLRDDVRTGAYYNAIMANAHLFRDKVVIDVGCGTGVLSIFCAWAGARKVFAIEASDMAQRAARIVADNGLSSVVQVLHSRAEDVAELYDDDGSVARADVIVSEWMGYFLVFEAMYESVFHARDRWLRPDGVMFPSHSTLFLLPMANERYYADRVGFWRNVYGVNMSSLTEYAKHDAFASVVVETIGGGGGHTSHDDHCLGYGSVIKFIDCRTATVAEVQQFRSAFALTINRAGSFHGFAGYFTVYFAPTAVLNGPEDVDTNSTWILSTAPFDPSTHWRQSLFFTGDSVRVEPGQRVVGEIEVTQNTENRRYLDVAIHWSLLSKSGKPVPATAAAAGEEGEGYYSCPPENPNYAHSKRFGFA